MATNIAETFVGAAIKKADHIAVIEAVTGNQASFSQLNSWSDGYANYFQKEGVSAGDVVILMVTPSIDFICLTLALFKLGAPVVLIDPGMGYKNLLRCIDRVNPEVLIGIPKALLFSRLFPKSFKTIKQTFCCGNSFGILGKDVRQLRDTNVVSHPVYQPSSTDLAAIIFTTGSTGPPKGVRYEHSIFSAQLQLIKNYYGICPEDIDQPAFPLFALFSAAIGARTVIPDMNPTKPAKVNPERFIDSIQKHGVSYSFGSPAIWNVVSNYCSHRGVVLESVKKVLMAGAPVPSDLMERVVNILPPDAKVYTPYGATESLPIVSIEAREVLDDTWEKSRSGKGTCVGRPLPGIELKIIRISDDPVTRLTKEIELPNGEIGEIIVRGEVVTKGYLNNPEEDRMAKILDSNSFWHRMGDVGYLDDQDRLWFCGRRAHRVVTDTDTLYSICCEAIINGHDAVYRSALVGIRKEGGAGETVPAIIVEPVEGRVINNEKLLKEVRAIAAKSSVTVQIKHFLIHKDFPVDIRHNAKIFREKLAVWAQKKIFP
ncbi:MAG: fatty acid CoA ligase family protein [Desulforhopalus sp.]